MAFAAFHVYMFAIQFIAGIVMVEAGNLPVVIRVTFGAVGTLILRKLALVLVLVTGKAILLHPGKSLLRSFSGSLWKMAVPAGQRGVLAAEFKGGFLMVKPDGGPDLGGVAGFAIIQRHVFLTDQFAVNILMAVDTLV